MYLFRIHIRPQGGSADMQTTFDYCLKHGLLGVGWRTPSGNNTKDWDTYFSEASEEYDNLQLCAYIRKWVGEDDLVWTRDPHGRYYLARVNSGWEYWTTEEAEANDIDIANIFRCTIKAVEPDMVPGKVVACFRAPKTLQEVADPKAREYSKHLWNSLSGEARYEIDAAVCSDIFMLLDAEETEDLVFLYLQHKGWRIVPNSRKADTMSFEYSAVDPMTGEVALTQVKTGGTALNRDDYRQYSNKIFLFQSNGLYHGTAASNVTCFSREELLGFLQSAHTWLPGSLKNKYAIARSIARQAP
jgi:hypothetical protein